MPSLTLPHSPDSAEHFSELEVLGLVHPSMNHGQIQYHFPCGAESIRIFLLKPETDDNELVCRRAQVRMRLHTWGTLPCHIQSLAKGFSYL